jgi:cytochrome c peroxidase
MKIQRSMILSATMLASCLATAAEPVVVTQKGLMFNPNGLSIAKGQSVDFVNNDGTAHNILIVGGPVNYNGGLQPPGGHVKYSFTKPGTYTVQCGIHPKMKLPIEVK